MNSVQTLDQLIRNIIELKLLPKNEIDKQTFHETNELTNELTNEH